MKRASFWTIILFLAVPVGLALAQLKSPPLGERESGGAAATQDGKLRWTNHWTMDRVAVDGKPAVHFMETGQGKYTPFSEEVKWKTESWWLDNGQFRPLRFEKTFSDTGGKALMREHEEFD